MQGLDLSTYFKYTGLTLDSLREQMRPQAERQVKMRLALEEISKLENIEVTDEEIDAEFNRLAEAYKIDVENVKKQIASEDLAADLKVQKAVDLVKASAKITEEAPNAEKKAPAKKTAAKKTTAKKPAADDAEAAEDAEKKPAKKTTTTRKTTAKKTDTAAKKSTAKADSEAKEAPADTAAEADGSEENK